MLRLFRSTVPKIPHINVHEESIVPNLIKRYASYESSKPIPKPEDRPKYEVTKDENDWKFVERLLPTDYVPAIIPKNEYPSGWVPQKYNPNSPYYLKRTKNGMLPVYLKISFRGMRRITRISNVHGDIWQFAQDLKKYLELVEKKEMGMKVHEICGLVYVHGDHVSNTKVWALKNNM